MIQENTLGDRLVRLTNYFVLALVGLAMLFPFLYVFSMSFSSFEDVARGGVQLIPQNPSLEAYRIVLSNPQITNALWISLFLASVGTLIKLTFTATMAYALSSRKLIWRGFFMGIVVVPLLFWPGIIPRFLIVKETGLLNSVWALIFPSAIDSFYLIIMVNTFRSLPQELFESAELEGANDLHILLRIVLPLSKPILAAIGLFYAVINWNMYFAAILYITDPDKWPLQVIMRQIIILGQTEGVQADVIAPTFSVQMATVIIATVPIIIIYPFLQRYFIQGALTGAIKG